MEEVEKIKIGTCAWSFDDWRGTFYPEHLPPSRWLEFYAQQFPSVEVDSTFYHPPTPQVAAHWLDVTPDDFVFSVKMPREITHQRKLRDCAEPLGQFLASITPLHRKLGAVLIQFPPYFTVKNGEHALREFVRELPHDFRFAIEFRDPSWHLPRVVHLLEEHRICWAWTDLTGMERANEAPFEFLPRTTDFLFVRMLGELESKYRSDGSRAFRYREIRWPRDTSLSHWREKIRLAQAEVARVFIYINNHFEGFSPHSVRRFAEVLEITLPELPLDAAPKAGDQLELL